MSYPVEGIRVLDLSQAVSGPYVGRILADLGADVVKVEWDRGDITNAFGLKTRGRSGLFTQMNVGKRGISIDRGKLEGADLLRRLAGRADVVIENFRPGVLDRAELGYETLSSRNKGLVLLSISGFGRGSPESQRRAYAPVVHAESGLLARQAEFDGRPVTDLCFALADTLAALHGTIAILAALSLRQQTGIGQHIDLSMLEAMVASDDYTHHAIDGVSDIYAPRGQVWDAPGGPIMIAADPKTLWAKFSAHVGAEDPAPMGADLEVKVKARSAAIGSWVSSFASRTQLIAALEEADLAWANIRTTQTLLESPTLKAAEVVAQVADGEGGHRGVIKMPYRFSGAECDVRRAAPMRGEHNRDVLQEWLGMAPGEIERLEADGSLLR